MSRRSRKNLQLQESTERGDYGRKHLTEKIRKELQEMQDLPYRDFHVKLMPTVDKETVIGIRVPVLENMPEHWQRKRTSAVFLMTCLIVF